MVKGKIVYMISLAVGICSGIYLADKLNFLEDVVSEIGNVDNTVVGGSKTDINAVENKYIDDLVLVKSIYDGFEIDLRYATANNITGTILYDNNACYLQRDTLDKLIQVNEELRLKGYKIKIWDAYRPLSVQKKLWAVCPNANYIANPFGDGSNHNRGTAVDVTLVTLEGKEVKMPSDFDEFGKESNRGYDAGAEANKNVELFTDTMTKYGFKSIKTEWWHFDDENAKEYPLKDFTFRELSKK